MRRPCLLGALLVGALFFCVSLFLTVDVRAEAGADLLEEGRQSAQAGELSSALLSFSAYKQEHPNDPRPYLYSGMALLKAGRGRDAAIELDEAAARGLSEAGDAIEYARGRMELGNLREAARALAEWEESDRLPAEGLWVLSDIHYRLKEAQDAQRVFEKFAARQPDDPRVNLRRGQIYIYLEEYEKALTSLEHAVWANPESPEAHFEMARTLYYGINFEAGKKVAAKAVALDPDNPEYLHLLGITCDRLEQYDEAVSHLEKAAELPGAFNRIYFDLGNALRKAGNTARAQEVLKTYRSLHQESEAQANRDKIIEALLNQGRLQIQQGDIGAGRSSFLRVLEQDPDDWLANSFLAKIYLSSGRGRLAQPHVDKLLELAPDSSEAHYLAAMYWRQARDASKALSHAEESKRLRPGDAELRNLLGNLYFALGQWEEAAQEYAAAVGLAPDRLDFQANHKTALKKLNR
ncbi:MAG TPA: tetratricopeptide repeat protein [Acidobacteriota bacterium]|nr:tetratricopeptide repeat protein [Acidobacteriota bacterium]